MKNKKRRVQMKKCLVALALLSLAAGELMATGFSNGTFLVITGTVTSHNQLLDLDYGNAGHTGFAGTGITNTFTLPNTFGNTITETYGINAATGVFTNVGVGISASATIPLSLKNLTTATALIVRSSGAAAGYSGAFKTVDFGNPGGGGTLGIGYIDDDNALIECYRGLSIANYTGAAYQRTFNISTTGNVTIDKKATITDTLTASKGISASTAAFTSDVFVGATNSNVKLAISSNTATFALDANTWSGGLTGRFNSHSTSGFVDLASDSGSSQGVTLGFYDNTNDTRNGYIKYAHDTDLMSFRVNGAEKFFINSAGNVGISSTTPTYLLTMEAGVEGGYYDAADNQWHNGTSFAEYKENIKDLVIKEPISNLMAVKLRSFNYKGQTKKVFGYVANELPKELADTIIDKNGGLTMNGLFVYTTSVMQAQEKKIENLEQRIAKLEALLKKVK